MVVKEARCACGLTVDAGFEDVAVFAFAHFELAADWCRKSVTPAGFQEREDKPFEPRGVRRSVETEVELV
jgi:hypothetical protein